jgi:hypothetical protein
MLHCLGERHAKPISLKTSSVETARPVLLPDRILNVRKSKRYTQLIRLCQLSTPATKRTSVRTYTLRMHSGRVTTPSISKICIVCEGLSPFSTQNADFFDDFDAAYLTLSNWTSIGLAQSLRKASRPNVPIKACVLLMSAATMSTPLEKRAREASLCGLRAMPRTRQPDSVAPITTMGLIRDIS